MTSDDDEALRRLRDADPARGAQPDPWQLRSAVDRAVTNEDGADAVSWEGRRVGRLGRGTAYLAAAGLTALSVGVGGYALGQSRADDGQASAGADDSAQEEGDDDGSSRDDIAAPEGFEEPFGWFAGIPGDPWSGSFSVGWDNPSGAAVRLVPGEGLSSQRGGEAEVLRQKAPQLDVDARLQEIAGRLDITGSVVGEDEWRSLREGGRAVDAYTDVSSLNLSYDDTYLNPGCAEMVQEMASWPDGVTGPGQAPDLDADQCLPEPNQPLSEPEALAMGRQLASDFGVDPDSLTFTVYDEPEAATMGSATSKPQEGPRIQLDYTLRKEGVMSANLVLREDSPLGSYPVISPVEAVERANDPILGRLPIQPDGRSGQDGPSSQTYVEPEGVQPGEPIPVPGRVVTATSATLSTALLADGSGSAYRVPIYLLSSDDGNRISVVALTEEALSLPE